MTAYETLVVDDLAADRQLVAYALQKAGWSVRLARNTGEAQQIVREWAVSELRPRLVITDLYMPNDPLHTTNQTGAAGSQFVLGLRAKMERGQLPRWPIVALTALTEQETHLTALAFGCDLVLTKPALPTLAVRIEAGLAQVEDEYAEPVGTNALLTLLRRRLAEAMLPEVAPAAPLLEQDITRALLAYQRQGVVGLGQSALAQYLVLQPSSALQRGEVVYRQLLEYIEEIMQLGVHESARLLLGELRDQLSPAVQSRAIGLSRSEYYRRRREAVRVLLEMLIAHRFDE